MSSGVSRVWQAYNFEGEAKIAWQKIKISDSQFLESLLCAPCNHKLQICISTGRPQHRALTNANSQEQYQKSLFYIKKSLNLWWCSIKSERHKVLKIEPNMICKIKRNDSFYAFSNFSENP